MDISALKESNDKMEAAIADLAKATQEWLSRRGFPTNPATQELIEANQLAAVSFFDGEDRSAS
jgi:hypothetical protein